MTMEIKTQFTGPECDGEACDDMQHREGCSLFVNDPPPLRPDVEFVILSLARMALDRSPLDEGNSSLYDDVSTAIATRRGALNDASLLAGGIDFYSDDRGPLARTYRLVGRTFDSKSKV